MRLTRAGKVRIGADLGDDAWSRSRRIASSASGVGEAMVIQDGGEALAVGGEDRIVHEGRGLSRHDPRVEPEQDGGAEPLLDSADELIVFGVFDRGIELEGAASVVDTSGRELLRIRGAERAGIRIFLVAEFIALAVDLQRERALIGVGDGQLEGPRTRPGHQRSGAVDPVGGPIRARGRAKEIVEALQHTRLAGAVLADDHGERGEVDVDAPERLVVGERRVFDHGAV
jgi:hypothetical protein